MKCELCHEPREQLQHKLQGEVFKGEILKAMVYTCDCPDFHLDEIVHLRNHNATLLEQRFDTFIKLKNRYLDNKKKHGIFKTQNSKQSGRFYKLDDDEEKVSRKQVEVAENDMEWARKQLYQYLDESMYKNINRDQVIKDMLAEGCEPDQIKKQLELLRRE